MFSKKIRAFSTKIMPFQQFRVPIPFATKYLIAISRSGKQIKIMANLHLSATNFSFEMECDDPYIQKLISNCCNWRIYFHGYSGEGSWKYKLCCLLMPVKLSYWPLI